MFVRKSRYDELKSDHERAMFVSHHLIRDISREFRSEVEAMMDKIEAMQEHLYMAEGRIRYLEDCLGMHPDPSEAEDDMVRDMI